MANKRKLAMIFFILCVSSSSFRLIDWCTMENFQKKKKNYNLYRRRYTLWTECLHTYMKWFLVLTIRLRKNTKICNCTCSVHCNRANTVIYVQCNITHYYFIRTVIQFFSSLLSLSLHSRMKTYNWSLLIFVRFSVCVVVTGLNQNSQILSPYLHGYSILFSCHLFLLCTEINKKKILLFLLFLLLLFVVSSVLKWSKCAIYFIRLLFCGSC